MGLTQRLGVLADVFQPDSSLNVGIGGAANSSYKLQVTGDANVTGSINAEGANFSGTLNGTTGNFTTSVISPNITVSPIVSTAQSGGIRLGSQVAINARNAANSSDITLITTNSSDGVAIRNGALTLDSSGAATFSSYVIQKDYHQINAGAGNATYANTWSGTDSGFARWYSGGASVIQLHTNGTTYFNGGNVGIGTSSPARKLDVNGVTRSTAFDVYYNSALSGFLLSENQWVGGSSTNLALAAETGNAITFFTNGTATERMRIASDGAIYFALSGGGNLLYSKPDGSNYSILLYTGSNSNVIFSGGSGGFGINNKANSVRIVQVSDGGNMTIQGTLTQNGSDERIKKNIQLIPNAIDKINSLRGVTFEWDKDIFPTDRTTDIGVIAQDVQPILPDAVTLAPFDTNFNDMTSKSGQNYLTVYYEKLIPLLIEGIKELSAKVTALENR